MIKSETMLFPQIFKPVYNCISMLSKQNIRKKYFKLGKMLELAFEITLS